MTRYSLQEQINYAARLKILTNELCVTQAQLANALGKDQKTVCRYISGETYPADSIAEIEKYLLSRCCLEDVYFLHIPSEEFDALFSDIYGLLQKKGIRETAFAKRLGISQKTLNNYHNHRFKTGRPLALSTEMQYRIAEAFTDYGKELFGADNAEYNSVHRRLSACSYSLRGVSDAWTYLIDALGSGRGNFFVYAPEKFELVLRYLAKLIALFNSVEDRVIEYRTEDPGCIPPEHIASVDFLGKIRTGEIGRLISELSDSETDDVMFNYYVDFFFDDTERCLEIYDALSKKEKTDIDALIRFVFEQKKSRITYMLDYFAESRTYERDENCYCADEEEALSFDPSGKTLTAEEADALTELFAASDVGWQREILNSFNAFFGRLYMGDHNTAEIRRDLLALTQDEKSEFISSFENEILKDFRKSSLGHSHYNYDYWYNYISEYMSLIAYSGIANCVIENPRTSEAEIRLFRKMAESLYRGDAPLSALREGIRFTSVDWYVNMLIDIALFKGMDIREMLPTALGNDPASYDDSKDREAD